MKTINEAIESAIEVIKNGKHYDTTAYITYWGKKATSYNFFFANNDEEAEARRARVERAERTKYTIVAAVPGREFAA